MRRSSITLLCAALLLVPGMLLAQPATYTWNGASGGAWTTATNWSPNRTAPLPSDIITFNATSTVNGVPTETIGKLVVGPGITVALNSGATVVLTTANGYQTDAEVGSGSTLTLGAGLTLASNYQFFNNGLINGSGIVKIGKYVGCSDYVSESQFQLNVIFGALESPFAGRLHSSVRIQGNVTVNSGTSVYEWNTGVTLTVVGTLTNNGSVRNYEGLLDVVIDGNAVNNGTWDNSTTTFTGTGTISATAPFNTPITLTSTAKMTLTSSVELNNSLTIEAGGELVVGSGMAFECYNSVYLNGKLSGVSATTSYFVSKGWDDYFAMPTEAPGAEISQIVVAVSIGEGGSTRFSGIGNLTSGASIRVDDYSAIDVWDNLTLIGGSLQLLTNSALDVDGNILTLDGVAFSIASGAWVDEYIVGEPPLGAALSKRSAAVSGGYIIAKGGTSIEQGGSFYVPLKVAGAAGAWTTSGGGAPGSLQLSGLAKKSILSSVARVPRRLAAKSSPPADPAFDGPITVEPEGTLTIDADKTLKANENVTVQRYYFDVTKDGTSTAKSLPALSARRSVQERGIINGAGTLVFAGYGTTFSNSGFVDVAATLENNGDVEKFLNGDGGSWKSLTIATGCVTTVNGSHIFAGSPTTLVLAGEFNCQSSTTISYQGSSVQTVAPIQYKGLEIYNAAGAVLPAPVTVEEKLDLSSGNFTTNGYILTLGSNATIDESGGSVIGNLYTSRPCTSGTKQSFGGLGLEFTPNSFMTVEVTRVTGSTSSISGATSIKRYFDLSTAASAYSGELVFLYKASELNGTTESALALYKSTDGGPPWSSQGGIVNTTNKSITLTGVTSLSRWTAAQVAPTLTALSPTSGDVGTTLNVALTGTNYVNGGTSVTFSGSGITVNSVTFNSATQVTANITIASGATAGVRDASVTTGGGTATLTSGFTVTGAATPAPTLASISPTAGATGQTTSITLNGSNFISGGTTVSFGGTGITVNSVTYNSATQVVANITVSSSAAIGARTVTVTTAGGSASLTNAFSVQNPSPVLTSISPTTASPGQNISVFLTGTGFMSSSSTVSFGDGITVADVSGSSTTLTVSIQISPTASVGARSVSVTNPAPGGGGTSLSDAFSIEYPAPLITNVSPSSGIRGRSVSVTVTGSGFYSGTTSLDFGTGIVLDSVTVISPTQMRARATISLSAVTGARNVSATNAGPGGGTATLSSGFTVNNPAPGITAISPAVGARGKSVTVQITGADFIAGATTVNAGAGATASAVTVTSPTQMTVTLAIARSAALGARDVVVSNPAPGGGSTTLTGGFTVQNPMPSIVSITPTTATLGQTLNIVVTGTDFFAGTTTADFGTGITVNSVSIDTSGTRLTANVTISMSAAVGARSVSVANAAPGGGAAMLAGALTVGNPVPTISGVTPSSGAKGQTINVTIRGTNFITGVTSADFGLGIVVNSVTVASATSLTASITIDPNTITAARSVSVVNAAPGGGKATLSFVFNVENSVPMITSLTPAQGARGENATVTVVGTGFSTGSTTLDFGSGITVSSTTIASPTQITATLAIAAGAVLGNRNVTVTNPPPGGGTATLTNGFLVGNPLPTFTAISPASGSRGQTLTVNLTGTGFLAGTTSVSFGPNIDVASVNVISLTQLSASVTINTAAATGARNIQVTNAAPGGGTATLTNGFSVTNPAPTLASVAPTSL